MKRWASGGDWAGEEPEQQRRYGNKDTIFFFLRSVLLLSAIRSSKQDILGVLYMDMTWLWAYLCMVLACWCAELYGIGILWEYKFHGWSTDLIREHQGNSLN